MMWSFDASLDPCRRLILENPPDFKSIIKKIKNNMTVVCCHIESSIKEKCSSRIVFVITITLEHGDLFFNSSCGYRAQYFHSPENGLTKNREAIELLLPDLKTHSSLREFSELSLTQPSAKIWLTEAGKKVCEKCDGCIGEWNSSAIYSGISNDRWEKSIHYKARYGKKIPPVSKLRVFGGFLTDKMTEWVPLDKANRAQEIHDYGWS